MSAYITKLANIANAMAPNGYRHHQGDAGQYGLARRLGAALGLFVGQVEHGYMAALAGLVEAITGSKTRSNEGAALFTDQEF